VGWACDIFFIGIVAAQDAPVAASPLRRKIVVVQHLRLSREQVVGDLESQVFRRCHLRMQTHSRDGRRDNAAEGN
jgi:hypothetical protein